jgi:replicative DNA helicase
MMQKHTMVIDDQPGLKITDLRARARRMKETFGIQFIVIDYLQLLSGSGFTRSAENRQNEISEISRMLKNLARELNVPVLCLSQLSRKVEERAGHKPMLSDLRESGCLTGDTVIIDAKTGHRYTIQELAERKKQTPISVFAVDQNFQVGEHKLVKAFYSGKKQVFELRTRQGKTIKASANHPFLVLSGWKRLDQLAVGDRIACARNIPIKSSSQSLTDQETILLAHLLGDGCILPNQPYHYTSADTENLNIVQSSAFSLFGINSRLVKQENWYHLYLPSPHHLTHRKHHPITDWFENLGIKRVRSYEKEIPQKLFESDERTIRLFLKHLWATDGNISRKSLKGRKDSAAIYYASSSPHLASQVQHLLHRSSIRSTLTVVPSSKGYRNMYHVHVQGQQNQLQFLREIGCVGKRAEIIPELIQKLENIDPHTNYDVIPKEAWSLFVNPARIRHGLSWRDFAKKLEMSYCGSSLFKTGISRERLHKINSFLQDDALQNLCESNTLWDEVVSITALGEEPVYDATVEGVHNFLANDIFVHNSIEQDSDVVMFLFRREYYDPYDKPGQASVIVAKNRHGAVGEIQMTYRKEMAQFLNFSPLNAAPSKTGESDPFATATFK